MFTINQSGWKDWQRCKKLYYYRQILNLEPKSKNKHLIRGSLVHDMVEPYLQGSDPWKAYNKERKEILNKVEQDDPEKVEEITKTLDSVKYIMEEYFKLHRWFNAVETERIIEAKLTPTITFKGQLDAWGVTLEDKVAIYELKTKSSTGVDVITERFRPQALLYAWALGEVEITHIFREFIFTPTINLPTLNKNGTMSRQNITCPWPLYKQELIKNGLDPKDYGEMEAKLHLEIREKLVTRINTQLKEYFVDLITYEAKNIVKEKKFPRTWNFDCTRCAFKDPCYLGLIGADEKSYLDAKYKQRESHYKPDNT